VSRTSDRSRAVRPRIADVAREAGVSKASVSFAFNQPGRLRPETATRIRGVAEAMGYRPHPVARTHKQQRTMMLGVLTPQELPVVFRNPWFGHLAEGISAVAGAGGYGLAFVSPLGGSLAIATGRAMVDGMVCVGLSHDHPEVEYLRATGIPMVLVDSDHFPAFSSVEVDDEGGARAATEHLLALGHRDVVVVAIQGPTARARAEGSPGGTVTLRRLSGYRAGFAAAGIELGDDHVLSGAASVEGGLSCMRRAWAAGLRPTAALCMADAMAIGALAAARELNLHVPRDLSIVGFDDIDVSRYTEPPLTTVHQPIRRKGEEAARLLLSSLSPEGSPAVEHRQFETRLVVRSSSGPARPNGQEVTRA
jgi:DNA-binding LacI/PurR family transcriptional regulator